VPIVPGILPISNFQQLTRFAGTCGAAVPDWLATRFEGLEDVSEFHFYTFNSAELTYAIRHALGLRQQAAT
jgi:methylenetetrahydrofolate reductase (NADPH)